MVAAASGTPDTESSSCLPSTRNTDLADLVDALGAVIWEADPATFRFTHVSRGAERLLGYPLSRWYEPDFWATHIHLDDRATAVAQCTTAIQLARDHEAEYRMLAADGTVRWVRGLVRVTVDASRQPVRLRGILLDLTEQRRMEEARRATEEQLRLLLDSTAEGIYGVDLNGVCTFCNRAAARLLGYGPPEDLVGQPIHALTHHTRADGSTTPWEECPIHRALLRGEELHLEEELFWRADGTSVFVECWSYPIRRGGCVVGAVVTFIDVTERRRVRQALEESEARFRRLTEASFDGIVITEGGVVREANRGFAEMFGYAPEEVIGRPATDFIAEESGAAARRRMAEGTEGTYELIGKRKDGRRIFLEATAKWHVTPRGLERVSALRDMTARRELEERLRQSHKMEAVGRLAGGVAHDFNNLLTVITAYADLLIDELDPDDPRRDDVEQIRLAATGAAGLTRQLLTFSRREPIEPRLIVLEEMVTNTRRLLERLVGDDIRLTTTRRSSPSRVRIDPGQLEQVLLNLVVNARDAMPTGGELSIETDVVALDVTDARGGGPARSGRFAVLIVRDTGIGMDDDTRTRIFEPFFTTKPAGHGTGLGLATVYGIVEQNGGFIRVTSAPGQGSTFRIYLPEAAPASDPAGDRPAITGPERGAETVLLVEDAPGVRTATREILERHGYTVLEAQTGHAALGIAVSHVGPIHLLLTDVVMAEMSGRELADQFTTLRPETRVLYVSGYADDVVFQRGVITYLRKPFSSEALTRKVREVLDNRE